MGTDSPVSVKPRQYRPWTLLVVMAVLAVITFGALSMLADSLTNSWSARDDKTHPPRFSPIPVSHDLASR